jgi:two-component system OmpR family response regulator
MNVLLVEDDLALADGLSNALAQAGFRVTPAGSASAADSFLLNQQYDLVILDLGLPDRDGSWVLERLRARRNSTPVLILTARDAIEDRVRGLQRGADDYIVKPFDLRELEARIHALIRRHRGAFGSLLKAGRLALDTAATQALVDGEPLLLSAREYGVLEALMVQTGRVVSKDRIAQRLSVSGEELADNAIEVYVHRLRKRIESAGVRIRTVRGLGYLLERENDA